MNASLFFANAELAPEFREEVLHGSVYYVRPLKIVRPMVLNGLGDGPKGQLLPAEELQRCPVAAWNSVPLTLGHPFSVNEAGEESYCSANLPASFQKFAIGKVFNARMDEHGRLAAEAWLDVDNAELMSTAGQHLISLFKDGAEAEVSSAYHFRLDATPGTHEGVAYNAIQRDIHPDHVAILLDSVGACSNADGCGLSVNDSALAKLTHTLQQFFGKQCACQSRTQNATFSDIGQSVNTALRTRFPNGWLMEVEDNPRRAIFRLNEQLVALPFSVDAQGRVSLAEGEPTAVQQSTSFVSNKEPSMEQVTTLEQLYSTTEIDDAVKEQIRTSMAFHESETKKQAEAKEARIVELAANKACDFTLDELKTMSDAMLDKVEKMVQAPAKTTFVGNGRQESLLSANDDDENEFTWVGGSTIPGQN